jgi:hypothetical protein
MVMTHPRTVLCRNDVIDLYEESGERVTNRHTKNTQTYLEWRAGANDVQEPHPIYQHPSDTRDTVDAQEVVVAEPAVEIARAIRRAAPVVALVF